MPFDEQWCKKLPSPKTRQSKNRNLLSSFKKPLCVTLKKKKKVPKLKLSHNVLDNTSLYNGHMMFEQWPKYVVIDIFWSQTWVAKKKEKKEDNHGIILIHV